MPARRFIMLVKESSPGVPKTSPVAGVDKIYLRIGDGTDLLDDPIIQEIAHGGGRTTAACAWSDQRINEGTINTLLYPGQAAFFLDWWLTNRDLAGTKPWPTTDPSGKFVAGDVVSVSVYEAIQDMGGTYKRTARRGVKVDSGTLSFESEGEGRAARLSLNVKGTDVEEVDATEFPAPTPTDYPCGPYAFSHIGGSLVIGTNRAFFDNFVFAASNAIRVRYWPGGKTPYVVNSFGRDATLSVWLPRRSTPDDFAAYSGVVPMAASFEINDGAKFVKVDLQGNNHWRALPKALPDGDLYGWNGVLRSKIDPATDADIVVTHGDVPPPEPE